MAERWAVASTAWSLLSTWNGGASLPSSGDDVYANGFTVTIDQDIVANSLSANAGTTAVAGGTFQCSTSRTIALQSLAVGAFTGSATQFLLLSGGSPVVTVAGALSGDTTTTGAEPRGIIISGGTPTITAGTCVGGAGFAVEITGAATVTLTAAVQGGTGSAAAVSLVHPSAVLTVHGSVTGGSQTNAILITQGKVRLDADLIFGSTGTAPVDASASAGGVTFMRGGASLAVTAPSDDDWPAVTGAPITLTEGSGGVDPLRFLNVGGVATPIQ